MTLGGVVDANKDVAQVSTDIDACFDTPVSCLSAQELSNRLVAIATATAKLEALRIETVRAAKLANVGALNDQRNVANHLAERTNHDPADTRADQLLADWLLDFAELSDAYRKGTVTSAHVDLLRKADNARVHSQMVDDQHKFVRWFTSIAFRDLDELIAGWLLGADPDGAEPKEHAAKCGLSMRTLADGTMLITGKLDPLQAGAFRTAVLAEAERIRVAHKESGIQSTVRQRQLEAMLVLLSTGYNSETRSAIKTLVNIVIDQDTYDETLSWLEDPANNELPLVEPEPSPGYAGRKSQLIDGTRIHPLYAIAASAQAVFRRIVYDAKTRSVETSFESRSFPPWIRDLVLIATNGKSANPVCDAPFHWLQTDHIQPHSSGGKTQHENARPLSGADNGWRGNDITRGQWPMPDAGPSKSHGSADTQVSRVEVER